MKRVIFPGWGMPLELYRPYSPDLIFDFGFFPAEKCDCSISETAEINPADLNDCLLENIIPDEPCVVIAHSLGALLALRNSLISENIKAIVLIGGFAKFIQSEPEYPDGKPESGIAMMQNMMKLSPKMVLNKFYQAAVDPSDFSIAFPGKADVASLKSGLQYLRDTDLRKTIKDINTPLLILHGDSDKIVSAKLAEFLAENIPEAKLHILKNAGHALPFTHTQECLKLINEFIAVTRASCP